MWIGLQNPIQGNSVSFCWILWKALRSMPSELSFDFNFNVQLIFPTRYLSPCWLEGWWGGEVPQILPVGMLCPLPTGSILLHPKVHLEGLRRWKDQDACSRTSGWLNKTRDLGTVLYIPYTCNYCTCTYFCNTTFLTFKSVLRYLIQYLTPSYFCHTRNYLPPLRYPSSCDVIYECSLITNYLCR